MPKKQTKKQYKYPDAFREKALATWEKLRAQGTPSKDAAKAAGVVEQTLYVWKNQRDGTVPPSQRPKTRTVLAARQDERPRALVAKRDRASDSEVAELKREVERLREENEILSQTVMVFAARRRS
jgi:transposase-like protein